jgi:hypothetical protein
MTRSQVDALEYLSALYGSCVTPFQMCPLPLFGEIIKINHLRMRATSCNTTEIGNLSQEAYKLLERIQEFSPDQWSKSKPSSWEDWLLIGKCYQASISLYCILSLQSLSVFPATLALRSHCTAQSQLLRALLPDGLSSPKIQRFLVWPLILLGVEAVRSGAAMRAFVVKQLPQLSRDLGTYVPLMGKRILETFWDSGETHWDACFDRAYVFTTQIAVDTSRMLPFQ